MQLTSPPTPVAAAETSPRSERPDASGWPAGALTWLPGRLFVWLAGSGLLLTLLGIPAGLLDFVHATSGDSSEKPLFVQLFELNTEGGVATWFSSAQILLAAGFALVIALVRHDRRLPHARHWLVLALLLTFASFDEVVQIHEKVGGVLHDRFATTGVLEYAWVIPYGLAVLVLGVSYLPFWLRLPRRTRWLCLLAACTFVAGALGCELAEGYWVTHRGYGRGLRALIVLEEGLEMLGMTVLVYAFSAYLCAAPVESAREAPRP